MASLARRYDLVIRRVVVYGVAVFCAQIGVKLIAVLAGNFCFNTLIFSELWYYAAPTETEP